MTSTQCFRVNGPKFIHETIDDEVIVANLEEGYYYSIENVGVAIWNALAAGIPAARVGDILAQHFASSGTEVERAVSEFVGELEREGLIVPAPSRVEAEGHPSPLQPEHLPPSFDKPLLQKFTDMQQLLLLDPIHEVDETGWPNVVPQKAEED